MLVLEFKLVIMGVLFQFLFITMTMIFSVKSVYALDLIDLSSESEKDKKAATRGNWFIATGVKYESAGNEFSCPINLCTKAPIEPDDAIDLFGGEIRLGREISLGGALSLILNVEGFFQNNQDETGVKPDDTTVDVFVSEGVVKTQYTGFGGSVGLGLFPFKWGKFVFLPVIEFGGGSGKSEKSVKYYYDDTLTRNEYFEEGHSQNFSYTKFGAGVNIIASSGIYAYLRFYTTNYEFESATGTQKFGGREQFLTTANNPAPNNVAVPASSESVTSATIGFGYRF